MIENIYLDEAKHYLDILCSVKPNRRTGSPGNRRATDFFADTIKQWGYSVDVTPFKCLDFVGGESSFSHRDKSFEVNISPYSLDCDVVAKLGMVTTIEELEICNCTGELLLMKGLICSEQLMPKNFIFYNPDHHKRIYTLLEKNNPAAIITATKKNPDLVGSIYPFPLIEDGDFNIPSVYCTEIVGEEISALAGEVFHLKTNARRVPSTACNVLARKNPYAEKKFTILAHIDAYGNSPGASDNASGTVVLLLLAEMLTGYQGTTGIEILAINGEDNYSAGGEMDYLRRDGDDIDNSIIAINIDDAGFFKGKTAFSFYNCPDELQEKVKRKFNPYLGIVQGEPWDQSDHMIFAQKGNPAMAITSDKVSELMANYTHSLKDVPEIVECQKLIEVANAIRDFILQF